jgi:hypothetical protein
VEVLRRQDIGGGLVATFEGDAVGHAEPFDAAPLELARSTLRRAGQRARRATPRTVGRRERPPMRAPLRAVDASFFATAPRPVSVKTVVAFVDQSERPSMMAL